MRDPAVRSEGRKVEKLPRAPRGEGQEAREGLQVTDVQHFPGVAFDVGPDVAVQPIAGVEAHGVEAGIEA